MVLENKLHLTDSTELARQEEKISKQKAAEMFETGFLDTLEVGSYELPFMLICSQKFMILRARFVQSILPKEVFALHQLCILRLPWKMCLPCLRIRLRKSLKNMLR